jgi:L-lactate dehydrogenase complex protein LldF
MSGARESSGTIHHLKATAFSSLYPPELANVELRGALATATHLVNSRRDVSAGQLDTWEAMRTRAQSVKADVRQNLAAYLEQFESKATQAGAIVHWARDAHEACSIITSLCAGATLAVKSKSMVSEEVGLNDALEAAGVRAVETDLGEWIVQIAGETPSHIVAPAIHRSRQDIRQLFEDVLGRPMPEDATGLTAVARAELRAAFASADVGISGANFLVAQTGSLLILENEGNIRMTTTMPRMHIALVGIEKLVPRLADLDVFLRLLVRSGTGQAMTSYQNLITGPKRHARDDGPDSLHIVLLDNGRTGLLSDDIASQTLGCIRCGACLNICPVYRQIGGHAYGSVYPGPIGAILTPQLAGLSQASQLPYASSLCGACRDVCPVKIDIPQVLLHLRQQIVDAGRAGQDRTTRHKLRRDRVAFALWSWAMRSPLRYRMAGQLAGAMMVVARRLPWLGRRMGPLGGWMSGRDLPGRPRRSFRSQMARRGPGPGSPRHGGDGEK